jgi:hypothetical protein
MHKNRPTLNYAMAASIHIPSNSLFTNDPIIRCYIVWAIESVVKWIEIKYIINEKRKDMLKIIVWAWKHVTQEQSYIKRDEN